MLPPEIIAVALPSVSPKQLILVEEVETEKPINYIDLKNYYKKLNNVINIHDYPENNIYPMPIYSTHKTEIAVGRIRESLIFKDKGCDLFVCGDQLLRGAAYNSVLISDYIQKL